MNKLIKKILLSYTCFTFKILIAQTPNLNYTCPENLPLGTTINPLVPTNSGGTITNNNFVNTYAGNLPGKDGTGILAGFILPKGLAIDAIGNLYVADSNNNKIRKISPSGVVTTFAGSGIAGSLNGTGETARFNYPSGVAVDVLGNVYVAEAGRHLIRKITSTGVVTTLAGSGMQGSTNGNGTTASFNSPNDLAIDSSGNLYVSDYNNHLIRKVTPTGDVTTFAGSGVQGSEDGSGILASFYNPSGISIDVSGNLYVADRDNNKIRKITPNGLVSTYAGSGIQGSEDGNANISKFNRPEGIEIDSFGNAYIADSVNNQIRKISTDGIVSTIAGTGAIGSTNGTNTTASFNNPTGIVTDLSGNIFVADYDNNLIRKITSSGEVSTLAGSLTSQNGELTTANFNSPGGIKFDANKNIFIVDRGNHLIRKITPDGTVTTFAGNGKGSNDGNSISASFQFPYDIAIDNLGNLFVSDFGNNNIRKITPGGVVTTFAGSVTKSGSTDGDGINASFSSPSGIAIDKLGYLYVADTFNNKIRKISSAGVVSTLAGSGAQGSADGIGSSATFFFPLGLTVDAAGNVYVASNLNNKIRKITPEGLVTTLAGTGSQGAADGEGNVASFVRPNGICIDNNNNLYVTDSGNNKIRKISPTGTVTTIAGSGAEGALDAISTSASFKYPSHLEIDSYGNLYVSDNANVIRKIYIGGYTIHPKLPTGLMFDDSTGIISGTPTQYTDLTTYTITATNASGSSTTTVAFATQNIPTFTPVSPICLDGTIAALPTTSNNSITGTWSPAINNAVTTTYTFTPDAGQDAGIATMVIEVLPYNCIDTQLNNVSCNQTLTAITDKIYAVPFKDAEAYRFEVVANGITRAFDAPNPVFSLIQLPAGALYNTTFSIRVAPKVAGVFGDYSDTCTVTSPEAVTKLNALFCGNTASAINTAIACKPVYRSEGYFFEITNTNDNSVINYETKGAYFQFSNLGITPQYATTYSVKVKVKIDGNYERFGDACTVSTPGLPTTKLRSNFCGATLPLLNSPISCDVAFGAQGYLFELTNNSNAIVQTYESKNNAFNFGLLPNFATYNTTYSVKVAVKIDGNYGAFGAPCTITTPALPLTSIKSTNCGTTVNNTTVIFADAFSGAQGYRFEITNLSNNFVENLDAISNYFKPSALKTKMVLNGSYSIRVAMKIAGNYGNFGNACTVYTASARTFASVSDFNVKTYPNPFDNTFSLDLETSSNETIFVTVYDMVGKLIESRAIAYAVLRNFTFGDDYAVGVYNVIVSQGNNYKTLRVIKK